jgi:hypothetical protein
VSLVVARQIGHEIRIVSDTKISDPHLLHRTPVDGGLKCIVLSATCCVSFAGNVRVAELALAPLIRGASTTRREITSHLLMKHRESGRRADFVVAVTDEGTCIDRVADGCLEENLTTAWIGDPEAFAVYQANYHAAVARQAPSQFLEERFLIGGAMTHGLREVIGDPRIESVGDFVVSVTSWPVQEHGFRYLSHAFGSGFKPVANTTEETSITETLGVEGGSYHYCVLVPTTSGIGVLAVHIREAHLGLLFYPAQSWSSMAIKNVDTNLFIREIRARFGITVDGIRT